VALGAVNGYLTSSAIVRIIGQRIEVANEHGEVDRTDALRQGGGEA